MATPRFLRFWSHLTPATLREIWRQAGRQRLPGLAAEMAFNAMLALFPAILGMLTLISRVAAPQQTFKQLVVQLSQVVPQEALFLVEGFIGEIRRAGNFRLLSLGFIASLWISSAVISAAMNALDQIHQIPTRQIRPFWKAKLVSLSLTIGTFLLMLAASTLVFISDIFVRIVASSSTDEGGVIGTWQHLNLPLALAIVVAAFVFIYRFGPSRWTSGTPILPGALLAAGFWVFLSSLFRLYVSQFGHYNRVYGAIGAVIVLLLWLQLSSLIILLGAQCNVTIGAIMQHDRHKLSQ
ncbi:MAG TPA: YihY/virulence factor BrkB family protein [Thermosynechococcaceae cyanobacterium]